MSIHWGYSKTDHTNKFSIPKWFENTPVCNFNITHGSTNNYQVTLSFMDNQGNSLNNTKKMKVDEHTLVLIKTDCTNKLFIPKLFENTPFCNSNINHGHTNNYQVSLTLLRNQGTH